MYTGYAMRSSGQMQFWNPADRAQQWVFDEVSKTIKSVANRAYSLGVHPNNLNYYYTTTNSRWN